MPSEVKASSNAGQESSTGGVKAFSIGTRLVRERERLWGMTNEERAYRAQYLKDQILSPNEPRFAPEYWEERTNIIRKIYRAPLDAFGRALEPVIGPTKAMHVRYYTGKVAMFITFVYLARYYFKYNGHDWTRRGGWNVISNRPAVYPGDPGFPAKSEMIAHGDYANANFKNAPI